MHLLQAKAGAVADGSEPMSVFFEEPADPSPDAQWLLILRQAGGAPIAAAQPETTAIGAAMLAGLDQGVWPDLESLRALQGGGTRFSPKWNKSERDSAINGWNQAIKMLKSSD